MGRCLIAFLEVISCSCSESRKAVSTLCAGGTSACVREHEAHKPTSIWVHMSIGGKEVKWEGRTGLTGTPDSMLGGDSILNTFTVTDSAASAVPGADPLDAATFESATESTPPEPAAVEGYCKGTACPALTAGMHVSISTRSTSIFLSACAHRCRTERLQESGRAGGH